MLDIMVVKLALHHQSLHLSISLGERHCEKTCLNGFWFRHKLVQPQKMARVELLDLVGGGEFGVRLSFTLLKHLLL